MPSVRRHRLVGAIVLLAVAALALPAASAGAAGRRGSASPARLVAATAARLPSAASRASVTWNRRVRVVRANRVRFLDARRRPLRARLLAGRVGRRQTFAVEGMARRLTIAARSVRDRRTGSWLAPRTAKIRVPASGRPAPATPPPPVASAPASAPVAAASGPVAPAPAPALAPAPANTRAESGAAFRDSVGVNVHMSYFDTTYNAWQALRDKLVALGVRNVRDGACVGCVEQRQRLLALGDAGMKVDFIMREPGSPESLARLVDLVAGPLRRVVGSIEGPNEYDFSGPGWPARLRAYQTELYQRVRANPALAGVPVIGPSLGSGGDSFGQLGDLSAVMDWGNVHPYAGGQTPLANLSYNLGMERQVAGSKPVAATEVGYHNALSATDGQPPTSEAAASVYVPRTFLEYFTAGVQRTFLYELVDQRPDAARGDPEQNFGLLRADLSEKPAFRTLSRLMALTGSTGVGALSPLPLQVTGGSDVRRLLLQTGPKSYALVLWRSVSVWDPKARQDQAVPPAGVRVAVGPTIGGASLNPLDQPAGRPLPVVAGTLDVSLGAMPVVVTLTTR